MKYKYKSKLGIFFSSIFLLATTMGSYASSTSLSNTVEPFVNVVKINTPSAITITESDIDNAAKIASDANATLDSEVYVIIGQYEACILSNALVATVTNGGDAGILMKVSKDSSSTNHYTDTNVTASNINQLALHDTVSNKKIKFLLMVTPSGYTASNGTFGSGTATTTYYTTQYEQSSFIIGGDSDNANASYAASYNDADATQHASDTTYENLALDTWGSVNQYGLNSDLQTADLTAGNGSAAQGLAAAEIRSVDSGGGNCQADVNPGDAVNNVSAKLTIKIYANAADLSTATAGTYGSVYTVSFGDVADADGSDFGG